MDIVKVGRRVHVALSVPSHAVVLVPRCYHVEELITSMYGDVDGVRFLYPSFRRSPESEMTKWSAPRTWACERRHL